MGTREKILVGLMVLAVLYGAFELFITPSAKEPARENKGPDIEAARSMAEKIDSRIEQAELTDVQKDILKRAGRPWQRDPFYVLPDQESVSTKSAESKSGSGNLRYTGYLEVGNTRMAIINGAEYRIGERLEQGGVVKRIAPEQVIIESANTGKRFSVPYSE